MTRWLATGAAVAAFLTLGLAPAGAGMAGAPHDLSGAGYGTDQICIFCHTPHHSKIAQLDIKLWNHETTTATYQLYGGGTTSSGTTVNQPGKNSKVCLSCHDGSVAIDSYGAHAGTVFMTGDKLMSPDLRDDHPIGVVLTAGAKYQVPSGGVSGGVRLYPTNASGNSVECSSCHGVHSITYANYLKKDNSNKSQLCLSCHIK
ncbi:MAG: cytochrome c3 family protein [Planctomycetes bacterium]|nr:cytochrome c3 family protein [Planctomycetota bacterium]